MAWCLFLYKDCAGNIQGLCTLQGGGASENRTGAQTLRGDRVLRVPGVHALRLVGVVTSP